MRSIGKLEKRDWAQRFVAYLISQKIDATAEEEDGQWVVWVHDEDAVDEARKHLETFQEDPDHQRYASAVAVAKKKIQEKARQREAIAKRVVDVRSQWARQSVGRPARLTVGIIVLTVLISIASGFVQEPSNRVYRALAFCDTYQLVTWRGETIAEKLIDIRHGQLWRLLTPIFLHVSVWHLLFNMMWLFGLGSMIELRRGPLALLALIVGIGVADNLITGLTPSDLPPPFTYLGGSPLSVGMSGVVYGLAGYLWYWRQADPSRGLFISDQTIILLLIWLGLGIVGILHQIIGPISNLGHLGGLICGLAAARLEFSWQDRRSKK